MKVHWFIVAGQSNATGVGDGHKSPRVRLGTAFQFHGGVIKACNDPVGDALPHPEYVSDGKTYPAATIGGSAWPAFARTYESACGIPVLLVPTSALGSSSCLLSQASLALGHWGLNGVHLPAAIAKGQAAQTAMLAQGMEPEYRGVLWCQGEQDAKAWALGDITTTQYRAALEVIATAFQDAFGSGLGSCGFYIFRTGALSPNNHPYQVAQMCQERFCCEHYRTLGARIVYKAAAHFAANNLTYNNTNHYTQAGYNSMGRAGALAVLADGVTPRYVTVEPCWPDQSVKVIDTA